MLHVYILTHKEYILAPSAGLADSLYIFMPESDQQVRQVIALSSTPLPTMQRIRNTYLVYGEHQALALRSETNKLHPSSKFKPCHPDGVGICGLKVGPHALTGWGISTNNIL